MRCVHGVPITKPCPDCEYEEDCRRRGVEPQNRWKAPAVPAIKDCCGGKCLMRCHDIETPQEKA